MHYSDRKFDPEVAGNGAKWTKILLQTEPTRCGHFMRINVKKRKRN